MISHDLYIEYSVVGHQPVGHLVSVVGLVALRGVFGLDIVHFPGPIIIISDFIGSNL